MNETISSSNTRKGLYMLHGSASLCPIQPFCTDFSTTSVSGGETHWARPVVRLESVQPEFSPDGISRRNSCICLPFQTIHALAFW